MFIGSGGNRGTNLRAYGGATSGKNIFNERSPTGIRAKDVTPASADGISGQCFLHERPNELNRRQPIP